jgi:RNA 3'-terminal phosphate cyclase (ATP)
MVRIDGSRGEGGGQILRTSLALSLVTGLPFRMENIRANRSKPGLLRQHLTAVQAAVQVGGGRAEGDSLGSRDLVFEPGPVRPGSYRFAVGTAGSTTLVLQTVLPALLAASGPSELTLEGGTHNPFAPPFDFLAKAFLPLLARRGSKVDATLERPGFYPAGGGKFRVRIEPCSALAPIDLLERGEVCARRARALVANLPRHIAERELRAVARRLGWKDDELRAEEVRGSPGPGNILILEVESEKITEVFTGFGERGKSAERVADEAAGEAAEYLAAGAPVGKHLADQLLVPLAIAGGGRFLTLPLTPHARTNIDVIREFLSVEVVAEGPPGGLVRVEVRRSPVPQKAESPSSNR